MCDNTKTEVVQGEIQTDNNRLRLTIAPTQEELKKGGWKSFIEREMPDFEGNIENARHLLESFQKGSDYIFSRFSPRFGRFEKTDIAIVLDESKMKGHFMQLKNINFVKCSALERWSKYKPNEEVVLYDERTNQIGFFGTPDQYFELLGLHETYHAIYKAMGQKLEKQDPLTTPLDQYHSTETEYRPLLWERQYAADNNFPNMERVIIQEMISAAQKYRKSL